ncbi:alginate lyase family protein [Pararhizobium mangrovi]|uniref:Alginate lyase family protein n=2 Tax=Pararhizobium mangrovi TaxID=2590452 RepID=A0A506U2K8_9HYPH|nr:alginate lyase family protein [Pararhizobium mangrovi]
MREAAPTAVRIDRASSRGAPPIPDEASLKKAYAESSIAKTPDRFVLYRIIGNDLPPRHSVGQSLRNLAFILDEEPELKDCEKRFVVNRIVDPAMEREILDLLERRNVAYLHLPFEPERYRTAGWDIAGVPVRFAPSGRFFEKLKPAERERVLMRLHRFKNNAVMNNNGARNAALEDGRPRAKWVLPFDGNCFFTQKAWQALRSDVVANPHFAYHVVPMARVGDNADLLSPDFEPSADEEPQILFRCDARERFDTQHPYGRRPKVELFWRLGVSGAWDQWPIEPWDMPAPAYAPEAGATTRSGWVARLFSGRGELEQGSGQEGLVGRGVARSQGVIGLLERLDAAHGTMGGAEGGVFIRTERAAAPPMPAPLRERLIEAADAALTRGPHTVVDKTTLPPSGDPKDYWHPAPYYWPHPLRVFPHVHRDGKRVPGTRLYEPLSERYDRTRLQRLFDDTFVLALAYRETGEERYAVHAGTLVRRWFVEPATAMNPHLDYAQVRPGHDRNRGSSSGIIETKDFYFFLDAMRILGPTGVLSATDLATFETWLERFLHWLGSSRQAIGERSAKNNHGTYYDLQTASIALYLGDRQRVRTVLRDSLSRICAQFTAEGAQPEELNRTTTAHYCAFNLQGWIHLSELAATVGEDLWAFEGPEGQSLATAVEWLAGHMKGHWPYEQIDAFDTDRFLPIMEGYRRRFGQDPANCPAHPDPVRLKPLFDAHDGIRPFWQVR